MTTGGMWIGMPLYIVGNCQTTSDPELNFCGDAMVQRVQLLPNVYRDGLEEAALKVKGENMQQVKQTKSTQCPERCFPLPQRDCSHQLPAR